MTARLIQDKESAGSFTFNGDNVSNFCTNEVGLLGSSIVTLQAVPKLNKEDETQLLFVFADLRVTIVGYFRIRFDLVVRGPFCQIDNPLGPVTGFGRVRIYTSSDADKSMRVCASIVSPQFEVFTGRLYPGMTDPTELSKHLKRLGLEIPKSGSNRLRGKKTTTTEKPSESEEVASTYDESDCS
ncbi:hypothetical protein HK098_003450 [Nowakowskiella sp. JEL0407]|nr:hypothetical protein HK098_003450 [Nowakowskiella sp. JEL0407]